MAAILGNLIGVQGRMGGSLIRGNQEFQFVHIGRAEIVLWEELVATMVVRFFVVSVGGSFLEFLRYKHTGPYLGLKTTNALEMVNRFTVKPLPVPNIRSNEKAPGACPPLAEVRGHGLLIGLEWVSDRATKTPDRDSAMVVINRLKAKGFLISNAGALGNVLKIRPPLALQQEHADLFLTAFEESLGEIYGKGS